MAKTKTQGTKPKQEIVKLDVAISRVEGGYCTNRPDPRLSDREAKALRMVYEANRGKRLGDQLVDNPGRALRFLLCQIADKAGLPGGN